MIIVPRPAVEVAKDCASYGDRYSAQCNIVWLSPNEVFICDLVGTYTRQFRRDLKAYLEGRGVESVSYERYRHGRRTAHRLGAKVDYGDTS